MNRQNAGPPTAKTNQPTWNLQATAEGAKLQLSGNWSGSDLPVASSDILARLTPDGAVRRLTVSGHGLGTWNTRLAALLFGLERIGRQRQIATELTEMPSGLTRMLAMAAAAKEPLQQPAVGASLLVAVGEGLIRMFRSAMDFCASVGSLLIAAFAVARGRGHVRKGDMADLVCAVGADALGIVVVANFLVGVILAFVGAVQLEQFGADIYVANLVGIATAREMAAIITATVVAGRTGAAFASEIAAMQGNEEIDALRTFGISPYEYLVLPRVIALTAVMPVLYVYATAVGIIGGLAIGVGLLDLTPTAYMEQTFGAVGGNHFAIGGLKSLCFGALIGIVGCHIGLAAGRSAAGVGRAATSAVVVSILGIILIDAVFAVCADVLGV